ncbi:Putrescine transport ATP-binding protein PotG (TC 3.A.1.11.2) [Cronobacter malonaticus 507]|nr:Putrescine transport ATP-binding protein PotG (TC 3.A.1.11.2) [Cronobacter malonaticus 507]
MNDAIPRPQAKPRKALTPLLEIRNLTKSFDGQHAVDDVSLTIYKGENFRVARRLRVRKINASAHARGF